MQWQGNRRSENIEDRRGIRRGVIGGGGVIVALVLALLGVPMDTIRQLLGGGESADDTAPTPADPAENRLADFASVVLADTEDVWSAIFAEGRQRYQPPRLVLFTGEVESACGFASAAVGPFYCPGDRQVYLDLAFFAELDRRFGAPGDFAQAYVIAHEVGHHVQTLLGKMERSGSNHASVRRELQADCLAGVWAHHAQRARKVLEPGDLEEALHAASAIGDDTLQKRARGRVSPETFTHGSAAERVRWFQAGWTSGDPSGCNTAEPS